MFYCVRAEIRSLKDRPFIHVFGQLPAADLEDILLSWTVGKHASILILIIIVVALDSSISSHDFESYTKLGYGQEAFQRGIFCARK
jgi:hypothetical protein